MQICRVFQPRARGLPCPRPKCCGQDEAGQSGIHAKPGPKTIGFGIPRRSPNCVTRTRCTKWGCPARGHTVFVTSEWQRCSGVPRATQGLVKRGVLPQRPLAALNIAQLLVEQFQQFQRARTACGTPARGTPEQGGTPPGTPPTHARPRAGRRSAPTLGRGPGVCKEGCCGRVRARGRLANLGANLSVPHLDRLGAARRHT